MDLHHTIAAMTGEVIVRVLCRTCKTEHQYRAPKGVKEPETEALKQAREARGEKVSAAKVARGEAPEHAVELEWQKLLSKHRDSPLQPYSAKGSFKIGDRIAHPTFGEGIVHKLVFPKKVEIVFSHDVKILIHAG